MNHDEFVTIATRAGIEKGFSEKDASKLAREIARHVEEEVKHGWS